MAWKKGQSGNPNGRPKKTRTLTTILARAGSKTRLDVDGKRRSGKRIVARMLWEIAATGTCAHRDANGETQRLIPQDMAEWFDVVKWLYAHIDGPPPKQLDIQSGGERINTNVIVVREILTDDPAN